MKISELDLRKMIREEFKRKFPERPRMYDESHVHRDEIKSYNIPSELKAFLNELLVEHDEIFEDFVMSTSTATRQGDTTTIMKIMKNFPKVQKKFLQSTRFFRNDFQKVYPEVPDFENEFYDLETEISNQQVTHSWFNEYADDWMFSWHDLITKIVDSADFEII